MQKCSLQCPRQWTMGNEFPTLPHFVPPKRVAILPRSERESLLPPHPFNDVMWYEVTQYIGHVLSCWSGPEPRHLTAVIWWQDKSKYLYWNPCNYVSSILWKWWETKIVPKESTEPPPRRQCRNTQWMRHVKSMAWQTSIIGLV